MSDAFDVIPYDDIKGEWKKLGAGSFGNVYKGVYLGLDVAIKEVLPSKDYDVAKYFEREWRLMKECRHPNICLFIGLSRAPDGRVFIVSEFIDNGNVRIYIHDKTRPFPWSLRMSFATDVTRALAYLHARKCIHRDLKGENLLVTSNGRIKVTDFGFARIAARNAEESKRLTFCGTDSYMSPEILLGDEFDLPTDIFSLGIIFCEIAARKLADDTHFKRFPPNYTLDPEELHKLAGSDAPPDFLALCMDCLAPDPAARPTTRTILERLRLIEAEVLARPTESDDVHVGSIKFFTGTGKRPGAGPRIPSFGMGIGKDIRHNGATSASESSDEELIEAIKGLSTVGLKSDLDDVSGEPLLNGTVRSSNYSASKYSTDVPRGQSSIHAQESSMASVLTVRPSPELKNSPTQIAAASPSPPSSPKPPVPTRALPTAPESQFLDPLGTSSLMSIASNDSYHTAPRSNSEISSAAATGGGRSTVHSIGGQSFTTSLVHRFTLLKPGAKPKKSSIGSGNISPSMSHGDIAALWNPLDLFFSSGLLTAKCDVCFKRIGWKPMLECDDCGLRSHVKCGEIAPRDCGVRPVRHERTGSPLSRLKQNPLNANTRTKSPTR